MPARSSDPTRPIMLGFFTASVIMLTAGVGANALHQHRLASHLPPSRYTCQVGDGDAACIPVRYQDGQWGMAGLDRTGALVTELPPNAQIPVIVGHTVEFVGAQQTGMPLHHKNTFYIVSGSKIALLTPDGELAVARVEDGNVDVGSARVLQSTANAARPDTMFEAIQQDDNLPRPR